MDILKDSIRSGVYSEHECIYVVDDEFGIESNEDGPIRFSNVTENSKITIAVGEPILRKSMKERAKQKNMQLASVISRHAFISPSAKLGVGVIIAPFVSVQAEANIDENVAVNTQAIIGHHVLLRSDTVISSQVNLGGGALIEQQSYVGMGAVILEKVSIGRETIIGAGSVVYKDIPDDVIALGNPARVARKNESKKVFR